MKKKRKLYYKRDCCLGKTLLKGQGKDHGYGTSLETQAFSQTLAKKAVKACPRAVERCWQLLSRKLQQYFQMK